MMQAEQQPSTGSDGPDVPTTRVVATAGHVDHGKSTLVRVLTGTDPDRWEEERRRGLTIDLGFAHTTLPGGEVVSFVDVPGHVRFLRNMLAGVGSVDACLFVVAASEGWKPQSEEHLRILDLLGVRGGLVVLTKADLVDADQLARREAEVRARLAGTFLADAPVVAVSAQSGDGVDQLVEQLGVLVRRTSAARDHDRPRLWIDRVFAAKGAGTVVTGTLTGGTVRVDDTLVAGGHTVRVRGVQSHTRGARQIGPGHRVALNLAGVDHHTLHRGDAVVRPGQWRPTSRFDASLSVLAALAHPVSRRGAFVAYIGSGEFSVSLRVLGREALAPGTSGAVRLHLSTAVPLLPGDRYVLRESGRDETVGGGEVLDVAPVLAAAKASPSRSVDRVVAEHGWIDADELAAITGERRAPVVGRWVTTAEVLAATEERVLHQVAQSPELGLELATLAEHERAVAIRLAEAGSLAVAAGRARLPAQRDPLADHPFLAALAAGGASPPEAAFVGRSELRELVRRGLVVERDGVYFHPSAIDLAARTAAQLLAAHPDGFTVAAYRDALAITRKHALPLLAELDARGITRRRDDLRIAGPRLPT
jgi:selenocysteine-specific elongation factor